MGDTISLSGLEAGLTVEVTLEKVLNPLKSKGASLLKPNEKFVGVQIRLANVGSVIYQDSPENGGKLIVSRDRQYSSYIISDVAPSFGGSVTLTPGDKRVGIIVFRTPKDAQPKSFQFALDSGFGSETGQWSVA